MRVVILALISSLLAPRPARGVPGPGGARDERGDVREAGGVVPYDLPRPVEGELRVCVILVAFADLAPVLEPAEVEEILFGANGRSMRDYFLEASGARLRLEGDVAGWVVAAEPHAAYGANRADGTDTAPRALAAEAVAAADLLVDFAEYDHDGDGTVDGLLIMHAGTGEERGGPDDVWSHTGRLDLEVDGVRVAVYGMGPELQRDEGQTHPTTIGVYCHELGHGLGLVDLYDTTFQSSGIGPFGLMGTGAWGTRERWPGDGPALPCAWSRLRLGWATERPIQEGSHLAERADVWTTSLGCAPGERFLLEVRLAEGFDAALPGSGLLIWHVDDPAGDNHDPARYMVDLEEADGVQDLELAPGGRGAAADFFCAENASVFGPATRPSSDSNTLGPTGILVHAIGGRGPQMPFTFGEQAPAPRADAGGPYRADECSVLLLDAGASVGAERYAWDLDTDGDFDDAQGVRAELDLRDVDGPAFRTVGLLVEGAGGSDRDQALVEIVNLAPRVEALEVEDPVVAGRAAGVRVRARDACPHEELVFGLRAAGARVEGGSGGVFEVTWPVPATFVLVGRVEDGDGGQDALEREVVVLPAAEDRQAGGCGCDHVPPAGAVSWIPWGGLFLLRRRSRTILTNHDQS